MPTITSTVAGTLTATNAYDDWWEGATLTLAFFDGAVLPLTFSGERPAEDRLSAGADTALTALCALTPEDRLAASQPVFDTMKAFFEVATSDPDDAAMLALGDPHGIWRFVRPTGVLLQQRHHRDRDWYAAIECRCDWEEEHDLQLVYRQGRVLTRVSAIDGHLTEADAFARPDSEDEMLSRF